MLHVTLNTVNVENIFCHVSVSYMRLGLYKLMGGATILKVGGQIDPPPLFGQWGTKYCLDR